MKHYCGFKRKTTTCACFSLKDRVKDYFYQQTFIREGDVSMNMVFSLESVSLFYLPFLHVLSTSLNQLFTAMHHLLPCTTAYYKSWIRDGCFCDVISFYIQDQISSARVLTIEICCFSFISFVNYRYLDKVNLEQMTFLFYSLLLVCVKCRLKFSLLLSTKLYHVLLSPFTIRRYRDERNGKNSPKPCLELLFVHYSLLSVGLYI